MPRRIDDCISQYFRCLSYCAEMSQGDVDTMQDCQSFCATTFYKGIGSACAEVDRLINRLVSIRQMLGEELAVSPPSNTRVIDLLNELSGNVAELQRLVRIRQDLTRGAAAVEGAAPTPPQPLADLDTPRAARKTRKRT